MLCVLLFISFIFFIQKKVPVPLETILPAAGRGLETCQFLRWPNTEGLISSVCSLSLSVSVYARERAGKPHEGKSGESWPVTVSGSERKKKRIKANEVRRKAQKVWEDRCSALPSFPRCIACHNESLSLHNPAQFLSTHLITNGD